MVNNMAKNIEPKLIKIGDYLKLEKGTAFTIPEYQRAYSWEIENCDKMWQDIFSFCENKASDAYFFVTIIILFSCKTTRNQKEFKVIDSTGQIVLFENEEVYIVAEYEEKNTTEIYRDEQTILDKKGIKTLNRYFEEVTVIDKEKQD